MKGTQFWYGLLRAYSLVPKTQALDHFFSPSPRSPSPFLSCILMDACVHGYGNGSMGVGREWWENLCLNRSHVKHQTCWQWQAVFFLEPVRDRCYSIFEVGTMSLTWPMRNAWQLPMCPQSAFKIALSVPGSRPQLTRASLWALGQCWGSVYGGILAVAVVVIREGSAWVEVLEKVHRSLRESSILR